MTKNFSTSRFIGTLFLTGQFGGFLFLGIWAVYWGAVWIGQHVGLLAHHSSYYSPSYTAIYTSAFVCAWLVAAYSSVDFEIQLKKLMIKYKVPGEPEPYADLH